MKKTLTLAVVLLLALTMLTACGSSDGGNNGGKTPSITPSNSGGAGTLQEENTGGGAETGTAAVLEEKIISEKPDPSIPFIELSKGEAFEDDSIRAEFVNYEIIDIPALREGNFVGNDPSYSRYMQFRFEITNKIGGKAKITISDISVNETIFTERSYSYSDIDPNVIYNEYKIQFNKDDNVELDPTAIETVRFHFFIYDASKGKSNYAQDPIYEGYLMLNTPRTHN